ncbi:MAG: hypothetical protein HY749_15980 [Gammaproteobacteria bacterium]|nr:hypothetical protein [Gammaproteobacteria bacterium]
MSTTVENLLTDTGVFKGAHGLEGLLKAQDFWNKQPYETRLYYGDGICDYLHRDVLSAAVRLLDEYKSSRDDHARQVAMRAFQYFTATGDDWPDCIDSALRELGEGEK